MNKERKQVAAIVLAVCVAGVSVFGQMGMCKTRGAAAEVQSADASASEPATSPAVKVNAGTVNITLSDGTVKAVTVDEEGKVTSTCYTVDGITYSLKANQTLCLLALNKNKLGEKTSATIMDVEIINGKKYKVTEIGAGAFSSCKKLKQVVIGTNIKIIGKNAFKGCKNLKKIFVVGKQLNRIGKNAIRGIQKKAVIFCPSAKKKAYGKLFTAQTGFVKTMKIEIDGMGKTATGSKTSKQEKQQQEELEDFEKLWQEQQTEKKERQEQLSEQWAMQGERRKKASAKSAVTASMTELLQGDGTYQEAGEGSQISIGNAQDLKNLSEYTDAGYNTEGVVFTQTADIDCTGVTMGAIGIWQRDEEEDSDEDGHGDEEEEETGGKDYVRSFHAFFGTYDGGNYHISNVVLAEHLWEVPNYGVIGLFGYVMGATIKNLNLDSMDIILPGSEEGEVNDEKAAPALEIGMIVGMAGDGTVIENCNNYADMTAPADVWDMAGIVNSLGKNCVLQNCANYGNLEAEGDAKEHYARIAGIAVNTWYDEIEDCANYGDIKNARWVAGIVNSAYAPVTGCENSGELQGISSVSGIVMSTDQNITDCKNTGTITAEGSYASGIAAYLDGGTVADCDNTGDISASQYAGGIIAEGGNAQQEIVITRCSNTGGVTANGDAGGIVGMIQNSIVSDCTNLEAISSQDIAGGIIGSGKKILMTACTNRGTVSGAKKAGGIFGSCEECGSLYNLMNFGDIESGQDAGGVAGCAYQTSIVNAWNHGGVSSGQRAGGILGNSVLSTKYEEGGLRDEVGDEERLAYGDSFQNCVNIGEVSSKNVSGAIIGESDLANQAEYCYYQTGCVNQEAGTAHEVAAICVTEQEWNRESFVEELNQNIMDMKEGGALFMEYDREQAVRWKPAVAIAAEALEYSSPKDRFLTSVPIQFMLMEKTSGEYVSMMGDNGIFSAQVVPGEEYEIFRVLSDGTYLSQSESISLQENENMSLTLKNYHVFTAYSGVNSQQNGDGTYTFQYEEPYYATVYESANDIRLSGEPVRKGYVFGGWYSNPYVYSEELYDFYKAVVSQDFAAAKTQYENDYGADKGWTGDGGREGYVSEKLIKHYGYDTIETLLENYDTYMDTHFKADPVIKEDYDTNGDPYSYVAANMVFAKWTSFSPPSEDPDPFDYLEPTGKLIKKSGVIYKRNQTQKTAKVVGVCSIAVKRVVIKKKVSFEGVSYRVTSVGRKAFANCKKLKKIIVKGNVLKKVHKTALKGTNKNLVVKAKKKIRKLFKKQS